MGLISLVSYGSLKCGKEVRSWIEYRIPSEVQRKDGGLVWDRKIYGLELPPGTHPDGLGVGISYDFDALLCTLKERRDFRFVREYVDSGIPIGGRESQ